jgi:hypothetical protein
MKIILTEDQVARVINNSNILLNEAKMACVYTTYESLTNYLDSKVSKKIGNNTWVERINPFEIGIKLHSTYILIFDPTDVITVNTNGWESNTTKDRLNQFLGCRGVYIRQKKGTWYIHGSNGVYPYLDGTQVYSDGHVSNSQTKTNNEN